MITIKMPNLTMKFYNVSHDKRLSSVYHQPDLLLYRGQPLQMIGSSCRLVYEINSSAVLKIIFGGYGDLDQNEQEYLTYLMADSYQREYLATVKDYRCFNFSKNILYCSYLIQEKTKNHEKYACNPTLEEIANILSVSDGIQQSNRIFDGKKVMHDYGFLCD